MGRIVALTIYTFCSAANAEMLCSADKEHDLVIGENRYTMKEALSALESLQKEIPDLISKAHDSQINAVEEALEIESKIDIVRLRMSSVLLQEQFYLGYPNKLAIVEGALLKQNVLALKASGSKDEYESALEQFCDYVRRASYID